MDVVEIIDIVRWVLLAVAAALLRGAAPVFMRAGAKRSDPSFAAALFLTVFAGASLISPILGGTITGLADIVVHNLFLLLVGGVLAGSACLCLFTALTGAQTGRVFPIVALSVVVLAVAGHFLLGEGLWLWRLCCLVLILFGTVLMESRSAGLGSARWVVMAMLALLFYSALSLLIKVHFPEAAAQALARPLFAAVACILLWVFALLRGKQRTAVKMGLAGWLCIPAAALCLGAALVCDLFGAAYGDLSWLAPISCLGFAAMLVFARIFLKEKLPGSAVFGVILVLLGNFAILMGW